MKIIKSFIVFILALYSVNLYSQGCSDAGFCSVGSIRPESSNMTDSVRYANTFKIGLSVGNTRYGIWIINSYITYSHQFKNSLALLAKMDGQFRIGKLTQLGGFSDITLALSYNFTKTFGMTLGGKIPFNHANKTYEGKSMPMAYQTSLGTYDAIAGLHFVYRNFSIVGAWQHPFVQNGNTFRITNFSEEQLGATYIETNKYKRAGDVLLRVSYLHKLKKRCKNLTLLYSLLPIYHYDNDKYTDADGKVVTIEKSRGLTLNANVFANYSLNATTAIEFSVGLPALSRKVRPDGMSQFALTFELIKRF